MGIPGFLSRQSRELDPHLEMRRGKGAILELWRDTGFLLSGDGYVGELLELHQGCQGPFRGSKRKVGFLSPPRRGKGPQLALRGESPGFSRVVAANMGLLSSYDGNLRDLLMFLQGSQVFMPVARGP